MTGTCNQCRFWDGPKHDPAEDALAEGSTLNESALREVVGSEQNGYSSTTSRTYGYCHGVPPQPNPSFFAKLFGGESQVRPTTAPGETCGLFQPKAGLDV